MKVFDVEAFILSLQPGRNMAPPDGLKVGNPDTEVAGIAVTWMGIRSIILEAATRELNLVISHEPVFFSPDDDFKSFERDYAFVEKMQEILNNRLQVYRLHDFWLDCPRHGILDSLAEASGIAQLENLAMGIGNGSIETTTLAAFAGEMKNSLGISEIRMSGDPHAEISNVGLVCGGPADFSQFQECIRAGVDCVVAGEAVEGVLRYAQDSELSVILIGHRQSEEPGLASLTKLLHAEFENLPVEHLKLGEAAQTV